MGRARLKNAADPRNMTNYSQKVEKNIKKMLRKNKEYFYEFPELQVNYKKLFGKLFFEVGCRDPVLLAKAMFKNLNGKRNTPEEEKEIKRMLARKYHYFKE